LETSKLQAYKLQLYLIRGRGGAELVEKVVKSNMGDSTISHKAEVLPEA
jgi:ribose 5-phosphate isomerase